MHRDFGNEERKRKKEVRRTRKNFPTWKNIEARDVWRGAVTSRLFGVPESSHDALAVMEDSTNGSGRSIDIELGGQEVITIDLDNLDPSPDDVLDLLKEGQCRVSVWTKLAGEYWRRGYLSAAERIAHSAIECT